MKTISPSDLRSRINRGDTPVLLDVREPDEHAAFNIGGILLPLGRIQAMQLEDVEDRKEDEIVVYCRSGMRSMQACMVLESAGFRHVSNLVGGMLAWQEMSKGD